MHQQGAFTSEELGEIESKQDQSDEAVEKVFELLETKSDAHLDRFLYSLLSTGHSKTHDFIFSHYGTVSFKHCSIVKKRIENRKYTCRKTTVVHTVCI